MPTRSFKIRLAGAAVAATLTFGSCVADEPRRLPLTGLNISGGEFGKPGGRIETDYTFPNDVDIAYAATKGFTAIRVPFLWERIQPALDGPLDGEELDRLRAVVASARARGVTTILDVHNYGRFRGQPVGSAAVPARAFARLWSALAEAFVREPSVVFGLMNEPHDMPTEPWAEAAQAALDAIRKTGAAQLVLVPGNDWTGAHSWMKPGAGTANAVAMRRIDDPCHNMAFELHQYLDADSSGTSAICRPPEIVAATLTDVTAWLRQSGQKGFLGEFGAGSDAQCLAGLNSLLHTMNENADVWIGWTYWAAGRWWPPTYPLSIQPLDGRDRPQMAPLQAWRGPAAPVQAGRCRAADAYPAGTNADGALTRRTLQ